MSDPLPQTPETAFWAALQAILVADPAVSERVDGSVFDEVPADDRHAELPWIYAGPMNRQRLMDAAGDAAWTVRIRLYAESRAFGRAEAWAIADAAIEAIESVEIALAAPFEAVDVVRVLQAGDVLDQTGSFKSVFVDATTTIQRLA